MTHKSVFSSFGWVGAPPAPLAHGTPTKFFTHNQPGFPYVRAAPQGIDLP